MSVSAVSMQEINEARAGQPTRHFVVPKKVFKSSDDKRYVDRFSDKKIAEFFAPYGYLDHERSEDGGTILVLCDSCQIIFDDFSVMVEPMFSLFTSNPNFNFEEFSVICQQANTTPSQAIADRLESEIFGSMPYYVEKKKAFNENNLNNIAKNPKYGKLLNSTTKKQKHRENLASLEKTYGSSDPEKIADTLARLIPGK